MSQTPIHKMLKLAYKHWVLVLQNLGNFFLNETQESLKNLYESMRTFIEFSSPWNPKYKTQEERLLKITREALQTKKNIALDKNTVKKIYSEFSSVLNAIINTMLSTYDIPYDILDEWYQLARSARQPVAKRIAQKMKIMAADIIPFDPSRKKLKTLKNTPTKSPTTPSVNTPEEKKRSISIPELTTIIVSSLPYLKNRSLDVISAINTISQIPAWEKIDAKTHNEIKKVKANLLTFIEKLDQIMPMAEKYVKELHK